MRVLALIVAVSGLLAAADQQQLNLLLKAQADFDRVDLSPTPTLPETSACVLSEAALLPVASPADLPIVHYRKGYCTLLGGVISQNRALDAAAAAEFQKAVDAWQGRVAMQPKRSAPEPPSSGLAVLAGIARLMAQPGDAATISGAERQIQGAIGTAACPSSVMPLGACQTDLRLGREWLGWIALSQDRLAAAAQDFAAAPDSGWPQWVAGRQAFESGKYSEAAKQYGSAVAVWTREAPERLGPPTDPGMALTDLGGAQLLAGDATGAIATLDRAARTGQAQARTFYYRARAREMAGQKEAALRDYSLASRTAFAATVDLASGEAHLYRGIAEFRRKDYARAEDEFSNALNFSIPEALRGDAAAWRQMAAVAAGNCEASRQLLARDLGKVSPYFPKSEAQERMASCSTTSAVK